VEQALGIKHISDVDIIDINFNQWFSNKEYRSYICQKLNIDKDDIGLNEVPNYRHGSSFEKLSYNGNAQKMKVLERYKQVKNKRKYVEGMSINNALTLSDRYFGTIGY